MSKKLVLNQRFQADGIAIELLGQTIRLLPDRAAFWVQESILLVADLHLGRKSRPPQTFSDVSSTSVVSSEDREALDRLQHLIHFSSPKRVIILGDLFHAGTLRNDPLISALNSLFEKHAHVNFTLVEGNHDRRSKKIIDQLEMVQVVVPPFWIEPIWMVHDIHRKEESPPNLAESKSTAFCMGGHIHPVAKQTSQTGIVSRLPCFVTTDSALVLPAFGMSLTSKTMERDHNQQLMLIHGRSIVSV